jgi:protein gp37
MDTRWKRVKWGAGEKRVRTSDANWENVLKLNRTNPGSKVFCASLSDWLDPEVPLAWLEDLLYHIMETPDLKWLLLTKRPKLWSGRIGDVWDVTISERLKNFVGAWYDGLPPLNVWIGTTVEDQRRAEERIHALLKIPAAIRFLSVEPMLEPITLRTVRFPTSVVENVLLDEVNERFREIVGKLHCVDWVICGGESGPRKRPFNLQWARNLRDECKTAGTPFFFKQVDKVRPIPHDLLIREFPDEKRCSPTAVSDETDITEF